MPVDLEALQKTASAVEQDFNDGVLTYRKWERYLDSAKKAVGDNPEALESVLNFEPAKNTKTTVVELSIEGKEVRIIGRRVQTSDTFIDQVAQEFLKKYTPLDGDVAMWLGSLLEESYQAEVKNVYLTDGD